MSEFEFSNRENIFCQELPIMRFWLRILYPQWSEQEQQESFRHRDIPALNLCLIR